MHIPAGWYIHTDESFAVYLSFAGVLEFDIYQVNTLFSQVFFGIVIKCQNSTVSVVLVIATVFFRP